ncbi:MAG: hypothetical protein AB1725_11845 [Armatimonadota bacterium]
MKSPLRTAALTLAALLLTLPSGQVQPPGMEGATHVHGSLDPNAALATLEGPPVTRYELAALFQRFAEGIEAQLLRPQSAKEAALPTDVPDDHWAAQGVRYLASSGALQALMAGQSFEGDKPATREDVAMLFHHLAKRLQPAYVRAIPEKTVNLQKIRAGERSREAMHALAKGGWLPYESPIFHSADPNVSPPVMAVALAQYARSLGRRLQPQDDGLEDGGGPEPPR